MACGAGAWFHCMCEVFLERRESVRVVRSEGWGKACVVVKCKPSDQPEVIARTAVLNLGLMLH